MSKYKFTFTNILFWVGIIASVLLFENLSFFNNTDPGVVIESNLNEPFFFLLFSIGFISFLALFVFDSALNKVKPSYFILGICLLLLVTGMVGIWSFTKMEFSLAPTYEVSVYDKIKHSFVFLLFVFALYATIHHFSNNHPSLSRLKYVFIIVILVTYFFVFFSIATEYSKYELIANADRIEDLHYVKIYSVFKHQNMFAGFLLMGILSAMALNFYKKNPFSYITIFGFLIIQLFVCSKTNILITVIAVFLYFLFEIIVAFIHKKKTAMLKLGFLLGITIALILLFVLCQYYDLPTFSKVSRFIYGTFSRADFESFTQRTYIWGASMEVLFKNPIATMFGYGFRNSESLVGHQILANNLKISSHNGYIQTMLNFGFIGFAILLCFLLYYIYCLIRLMKKETRFALIFSVCGLAYIVLAFMESLNAFAPSAQGILIGALFFLPVINKYHHLKHKEVVESIINKTAPLKLLKPEFMVRAATRFILALLTVTASLFVIDVYREEVAIKYLLLNITSILGMYLIFFPYLNGLFAKGGSVGKYILHLLMYTLVNEVAVTPFVLSYIFLKPLLFVGFEWLIPASLCFVNLLYVAIYSGTMRGSFKLYLNTFIGFKTSLGSLIGISGFVVALQASQVYLDMYFFVTIILVVISGLLVYFVFTFLTPFKDTRAIVKYVSSYDLDIMKKEVIRDQLGVYRNAY